MPCSRRTVSNAPAGSGLSTPADGQGRGPWNRTRKILPAREVGRVDAPGGILSEGGDRASRVPRQPHAAIRSQDEEPTAVVACHVETAPGGCRRPAVHVAARHRAAVRAMRDTRGRGACRSGRCCPCSGNADRPRSGSSRSCGPCPRRSRCRPPETGRSPPRRSGRRRRSTGRRSGDRRRSATGCAGPRPRSRRARTAPPVGSTPARRSGAHRVRPGRAGRCAGACRGACRGAGRCHGDRRRCRRRPRRCTGSRQARTRGGRRCGWRRAGRWS